MLPAGSPLIFVVDDTVNARNVRTGSVFKVHLSTAITLDGTMIAPAGTIARLVVTDRTARAGGAFTLQLAIEDFRVRGGLLPVAIDDATFENSLAPGVTIPVKTMGSVEELGSRTVIRVPLPYALPADVPNGSFTPIPASTVPARVFSPAPTRGRPGSPPPTASPVPSPWPTASPADAG